MKRTSLVWVVVLASCLDFRGAQDKYCQAHPSVCAVIGTTPDGGGVDSDGGAAGQDGGNADGGSSGKDAGGTPYTGGYAQWSLAYGSTFMKALQPGPMGVNAAGTSAVGGAFRGQVDFGGQVANPLDYNLFFASYGIDGGLQWLRTVDAGVNVPPFASVQAVTVDPQGAVYSLVNIPGGLPLYFDPSDPGGHDPAQPYSLPEAALVRWAADGGYDWTVWYEALPCCGDPSPVTAPMFVRTNPANNQVVVFGLWRDNTYTPGGLGLICNVSGCGNNPYQTWFLEDFDADGGGKWMLSATNCTPGDRVPPPQDLAVDVNGDIYALGSMGSATCSFSPAYSADGGEWVIAKYDLNGGLQWAYSYDWTPSVGRLAVSNGSLWLAGSLNGPVLASVFDGGIVAPRDGGAMLIQPVRGIDGALDRAKPGWVFTNTGSITPVGMFFDSDAGLWLAGQFTGAGLSFGGATFNQPPDAGPGLFLVAFDTSSGALVHRWSKQLPAQGATFNGFALDNGPSPLVSGTISNSGGTVDLGGGGLQPFGNVSSASTGFIGRVGP